MPCFRGKFAVQGSRLDVSYSLNSLEGVKQGIIRGSIIGVKKGDTRSLDYSSCKVVVKFRVQGFHQQYQSATQALIKS